MKEYTHEKGTTRRRKLMTPVLWFTLAFALSKTFDSILVAFQPDLSRSLNAISNEPVMNIRTTYGINNEPGINDPRLSSMRANKTFHVLYGLMGTKESMYDAWGVSLKSILVNAPVDANMEIHVMCSQEACDSVKKRVKDAELEGSLWRNQIAIKLYNVEAYNQEWREFLRKKMRREDLYERVSLGGYYRLLAYQILAPLNIGTMLYLDTDVIVIANLNDLMTNMDETKVFQGSPSWFCSGFTVLNMQKFHEFWQMVDQLETVSQMDQDIMEQVLKSFPNSYGYLTEEWNRNMGNGYRRKPHSIMEKKEAAGMLHYQGGSSRFGDQNYFTYGFDLYCDRSKVCRKKEKYRKMVAQSWGLGDFYTRLSWKWAIYFGKSAISSGENGFALRVNTIITNPSIGNATST